ncbi:MAG: DUF2238 domain-containing protein [Pseudomonadota bacterium]
MKNSMITSALLLLAFVGAALYRANYEFLFYASTLVILLVILFLLDRRFNFSQLSLWGFNLWMLLHLVGGMGSIGGTRMYDLVLLPLVGEPYDILKYDQVVHLYCYVVMAMLVFEVLVQLMNLSHRGALFLVTVLAASGIGGLNEVIEFAAVVFVGSTGVGGYTNTALDLVANLIGAMIGAGWMVRSRRYLSV